jgi:hypothetical protein
MFQRVSNTTGPRGSSRASPAVRQPEPRNASPLAALSQDGKAGDEDKILDKDDPLERAADRAAESVMRAKDAAAPASVGVSGGPPLSAVLLGPGPAPPAPVRAVPPAAAIADPNRISGGEPLSEESRQFFEPRFGRPLGQVRLHADAGADETARGFGAKAFAYGNHIGFRSGLYDPASGQGKLLLAHEIAHVLQRPGRVALKKDANDPPDAEPEPDVKPILPKAKGAGNLLEEALGHIKESFSPAVGEKAREQFLATLTYMIIGDRLTWYRADGTVIDAFSLLPDANLMAPGIYVRDTDDKGYRYVFLNGKPKFVPWVWDEKKKVQVKFWIRPKDMPAFEKDVAAFAAAAIVLIRPPYTGSAARDTRAAKSLVDEAIKKQKSRQADSSKTPDPSESASPKSSKGESADKDKPKTPQQKIGDPPDSVKVWSDETGVYATVTVDKAKTTIAVNDEDSVEDVDDRIADAADALREARDPEKSDRVDNKVKTTGFVGKPDKAPEMAHHDANLAAYPAQLIDYDPDITVPGSISRFEMKLDYTSAGGALIDQVTARMQNFSYYWELLNVTKLGPNAQEAAGLSKVGSGEQQTNWKVTKRDVGAEGERVVEDTGNEMDELAASRMPLEAKATWVAVIGVSNVVRMAGSAISSFISVATKPLNEQRITWDNEGDFLVRCVATPSHDDDAKFIRASSWATQLVRVEKIHRRAASVADSTEKQIADLEAQKAKAATDAEKAGLDKKIEALRQTLTKTTAELGGDALRSVNQRLEVAEMLDAANAARTKREDRDPRVRLLAVQLELQHIELHDYLESLRGQQTEIQGRLKLSNKVVDERMPLGNYHPRVVLISEENGQTYDLLTVLGEAQGSAEGHRHYLLADVTTSNPHDRYVYEGESSQTGIAGHSEAIRNAFVDFRENNGYGRGTIAIRLPSTLTAAVGGEIQIEPEMRSAPGSRARVIQRLKDLATAAEIASVFVTGPAGLAIGTIGGIAGAIVAIDSIQRRRQGVDFSWLSFQTIMDISSVVGGVAGVGGLVTKRLQGVLHVFGVAQLASQGVIIPVQLEMALGDIEEQLRSGRISEGEAAARRAEAFLQAVRSGVVTTVTAARMSEASHDAEPATGQGKVGEPLTPEPDVNDPAKQQQGAGQEQGTGAKDPAAAQEHAAPDAPTQTRSPRIASLEAALSPDLQGKISVVEGAAKEVPGKSARVRYRGGEIRIEVGPEAGPEQIRSHEETARALMKYQGPVGALRRLMSHILEIFTGIPAHGREGFEASLEGKKLNAILDTLRLQEAAIQQKIEKLGGGEGSPSKAELESIRRDIENIEYQAEYHKSLVDSLAPGTGYVAAYDKATETQFPGLRPELDSIFAGLGATAKSGGKAPATPGQGGGNETLSQVVDRMAELQRQGRVVGMEDWIRDTGAQAGNQQQFRQRLAELAAALDQAQKAPAGERVRLVGTGTAGAQTFGAVTEVRATGGRVKSVAENELRDKVRKIYKGDPAKFDAAFDSIMDRQAEKGEAALKGFVDNVKVNSLESLVGREQVSMEGHEKRIRQAATHNDPLNPRLSNNVKPDNAVEFWLHYEGAVPAASSHEIAQGKALQALTGEEVHMFLTDPLGAAYPAIDGTIGKPGEAPRPMQLKQLTPQDPVSGVRRQAQAALAKGTGSGVDNIEVYIDATRFKLDDIKAGWNSPTVGHPPVPAGNVFGPAIKSIEIACSDEPRVRVNYDGKNYTFVPVK